MPHLAGIARAHARAQRRLGERAPALITAFLTTSVLDVSDRRTAWGTASGAFRMVVGLFDDLDPGSGVSDFFGLGDSGDVINPAASFRRLIQATLAYHAVRAARRQQGPLNHGRDLSIARAVIAAQNAEVCSSWPPTCDARTPGVCRRSFRAKRCPPSDPLKAHTPTHTKAVRHIIAVPVSQGGAVARRRAGSHRVCAHGRGAPPAQVEDAESRAAKLDVELKMRFAKYKRLKERARRSCAARVLGPWPKSLGGGRVRGHAGDRSLVRARHRLGVSPAPGARAPR